MEKFQVHGMKDKLFEDFMLCRSNNNFFLYIRHESVRVGEISKRCHSFFLMFITSVGPEWPLCRGKLAVPGHKRPLESSGSPGRGIPGRGDTRNIEF